MGGTATPGGQPHRGARGVRAPLSPRAPWFSREWTTATSFPPRRRRGTPSSGTGNNDLPFPRPDLCIPLADPRRAGHGRHYHPGESNFRSADVILITKPDWLGTRRRRNPGRLARKYRRSNPLYRLPIGA
jgi:hypothetical protein